MNPCKTISKQTVFMVANGTKYSAYNIVLQSFSHFCLLLLSVQELPWMDPWYFFQNSQVFYDRKIKYEIYIYILITREVILADLVHLHN